jgi:hypothetical protein
VEGGQTNVGSVQEFANGIHALYRGKLAAVCKHLSQHLSSLSFIDGNFLSDEQTCCQIINTTQTMMMADPSNLSPSEHERPKKWAKSSGCDSSVNIQMTLGFSDAANEEDPALLTEVLMYIATSTELVRTRQVCRAFRKCSDKIAKVQVASLIGSIRPMANQSIVGLLHGTEGANDLTRRNLKEWNADIRAEGFDIGLPTKNIEVKP